jgi:hypothetical protein
MTETCDYCHVELGTYYMMRAVGFTDFEGNTAPLVKTWCGKCETPDDIDDEASDAVGKAIRDWKARQN